MAEPRAHDLQVGRREDPRARARLSAKLATVPGRQTVTLNNLSRGGTSVTADLPLRRGADVILRWRDIEAFAKVTWVEDCKCGLMFDEPMSDEQVLLARYLSDNRAAVEKAEVVAAAHDFANGILRLSASD